MRQQLHYCVTLALAMLLSTAAIAADVKPAPAAPAAAKDDAYEKSVERARKSAEEQAKLAESAKSDAEKQAKAEAEAAKKLADAKAAEKAAREKEENDRRAEDARQTKEEARKQAQRDRERSCVYKPVMTDAEIANCKKVWKDTK